MNFVFCVATVLCANAMGQTPPLADGKTSLEDRRELSRSVMKSVRDGDLGDALNALDALSIADASISFTDENPLSLAGAALHRALAQLNSEAQFELLNRWSISMEPQPRIRQFTVLVPTTAPPSEFARALGERPRAQSFAVASVGEVQGVFSTGWALVVAARDTGRLKRLTAELRTLVDKRTPNAETLLSLALVADGSGDLATVTQQLTQRTNGLKAPPASGAAATTIAASDVSLAAAASHISSLRPLSRELFEALMASTAGQPAPRVRPFFRDAMTSVSLLSQSGVDLERVAKCRLKYWIPIAGKIGSRAVWQIIEDHVAHLSGGGSDTLMFRYPLQGDFGFSCDALTGGRIATDGGLLLGGERFHANSRNAEFCVLDLNGLQKSKRFCPFIIGTGRPKFDRMSIAITPGGAGVAADLHPMWSEKSDPETSRWIGLSSLDENLALFRNLKFTGQPTIPRSVRMSQGNLLRGWRFSDKAWRLADGVIHAPEREPTQSSSEVDQHLFYQRPLFAGESISYEFFYHPGVSEVSPTLGRVALLLQPDGVRIHWVTDRDSDWTGLTADNSVTEPLNRRGPRPLPFKLEDWNRVTVACTEHAVTLSLNDVVAYQQPVDRLADLRFGLCSHRATGASRIRNVVMTGDWPESVLQDTLDNPLVTSNEQLAAADRRALGELFQEDFVSHNVAAVRRRALELPVADRFEFLSQWILPGPDHAGIRIAGLFTATRPSPMSLEPGVEYAELGGQVVSPVFDWLDAARELGRLPQCRQQVDAIVPVDQEFQTRAKLSLLLMISLEQGDAATHDGQLETLLNLIKTGASLEGSNHWPEMLLATRLAEKAPDSAMFSELLLDLAVQRMLHWRLPDVTPWHNHLASLHGQMLLRRQNALADSKNVSTTLNDWIPVTAGKSMHNGSGYPNLIWSRRDNQVVKVSAYDIDYLFYRQPLSGNFTVEADLIHPNQDPVTIMVAGTYAGPLAGFNGLDNGSFRAAAAPILFETPMSPSSKPVRFRAVVQDGVRTVYLNGRKVHFMPLSKQFDPWIAIRSTGRLHGTVADVRITGQPTVLESVPLSNSGDLTGWLEYHEDGKWEHVETPDSTRVIVGRSNAVFAGTSTESLLRYQRPLVEDGMIEYEFFYEPGVADVHPALDRLAFVLDPSGVREHWITDGRHNHVELSPANLSDVSANRRGPAELPLMPGKWNRVSLAIRGETAAIRLNETLVYERVLERSNQRAFGLFHFADATEAQVRNVDMRGEWPKQVPAVADQELSGHPMDWLDDDLPRLTSVFRHDFAKEGLPEKYFELPNPNLLNVTPDGVLAVQDARGPHLVWDITPRFSLSGNFDLEASFDQGRFETGSRYGGVLLRAIFDDPEKPCYDIHRLVNESTHQLCQASHAFTEPKEPGASRWRAEVFACEANSGRFRLARRGTKLYYLMAEGDSKTYHLFDTKDVSTSDLARHAVRLQTFAVSSKVKVVWKDVVLRAERMTFYSPPSKSDVLLLKIIQADGTGLRTIKKPSAAGYTHVGSPEWSADGSQIAVDMSNGSTTSSHIVVMNPDGSGLKDLGLGCMPSFSGDGSRIVFSEPGQGIMTMKSDGTDRQVLDSAGWGTQWSPDGKWIAYGKAGNITLRNVATGATSQLLDGENAQRYSYIFWNLAWSHDSRAIAFKARTRRTNAEELAVAEINSRDGFKVLIANAAVTHPDITFSPDNERVIASINDGSGKGNRLHAIHRKQPGPPELLDLMPVNQTADGVGWSRDGKSIAFTAVDPGEPVEWTSNMKTESASR